MDYRQCYHSLGFLPRSRVFDPTLGYGIFMKILGIFWAFFSKPKVLIGFFSNLTREINFSSGF